MGESHDAVSWNTLILSYADQGFRAYVQMQDWGFLPDIMTFRHSILKDCGNRAAL